MSFNPRSTALPLIFVATLTTTTTLAATLDPNDPMFDANAAMNTTNDWTANNAFYEPGEPVIINTGGASPEITATIDGGEIFPEITITLAKGIVFDQGPSSQNGVDNWNRNIAVFVFPDNLLIDGTFSGIQVTGQRPFAILARGNITLNKTIDISGGDGQGASGGVSPSNPGNGVAGGGDGGAGFDSNDTAIPPATFELATGEGPGAIPPTPLTADTALSSGAAFGGFGSDNLDPNTNTYGDLLQRLQAGSGGTGFIHHAVPSGAGGAGGGAIELGATGNVTINQPINASGGQGGDDTGSGVSNYGGPGSGGGVLLHGNNVNLNSTVNADSGNTLSVDQPEGGGGRVAILESNLTAYNIGNSLATIGLGGVSAQSRLMEFEGFPIYGQAGVVTITPALTRVPTGLSANLHNGYIASATPRTHDNELIRAITETLRIRTDATVDYQSNNPFDDNFDILLNAGGELNTNGHNDTISEFTLNGTVNIHTGSTLRADIISGAGTAEIETSATLDVGWNNSSSTFDGEISGQGGLTKSGTGTLDFNGLLTYFGPTTLNDGTITISQGLTTPGQPITVNAPATLNAAGIFQRDITGDGTINATAPLVLGSLTSPTAIDFDGTLNVGSNQLILFDADTANLGTQTNLDNGGQLIAINGATLDPTDTLTATAPATVDALFTNNGTVNGPTTMDEFLTFQKDVNGTGSYTGNIQFLQAFSPGASPATVTINGNAQLSPTTNLILELAGPTPGDHIRGHDQLNITNTLHTAGTLTIALLDNYHPQPNDTFQLLTFANTTGAFTTTNLPPLNHGLTFDTTNLLTNGTLTVIPQPSTLVLLALLLFPATTQRRSFGYPSQKLNLEP